MPMQRRLICDAMRGLQRSLEKTVDYRTGCLLLVGHLIGLLDLSKNLGLADDHAVETTRDEKQMSHGIAILAYVQVCADATWVHPVEGREKVDPVAAAQGIRCGGGTV